MKPVVSVCTITYNHEKYIDEAIQGFLIQKTSFPVEMIIGDDNSTDNTAKIVTKYRQLYPNLIKYHRRTKNLGMMKNFAKTLEECEGKYIALCEGDDYWTDPNKLQKQVDFLESHRQYIICAHDVKIKKNHVTKNWYSGHHHSELSLSDLMKYGSGGATCSLIYRNRAFGDFPDWFYKIKGGDWTLQLLCATQGKMRCLPDVMGVYRRHNQGSIQAGINQEKKVGMTDLIGLPYRYGLEAYDIVDKAFGGKYSSELNFQRCYALGQLALEYYFVNNYAMAKKFARQHFCYYRNLNCGLSLIQHLALLRCLWTH